MTVVGIDLGTTNSVVAFVDEAGLAHAIADPTGNRIVPSAVWFPPDDPSRVEVGALAKRRRRIEPENVATLFKRGMGESTFLPSGQPFMARGTEWRPEVLSSIVVKKLVGIASDQLRERITDVVITVPAYFGEAERAATRLAGELAELQVHLLPAEPMAAAVAHGLDADTGPSTILVFDLGGGTFDVTVLRKEASGQLEAVAHNGDRRLGGADFDQMIVDRMAAQAMSELRVDLRAEAQDLAEAYLQAEQIKIDLSSRDAVEEMVLAGGKRMVFEFSRAEFESLIAKHLENTELTVESALDTAELTKNDIDAVLLVGGSCRIPAFQAMLRNYFGKEPLLSRNLDEDVARGAALMGVLRLGLAPEGSALSRLPPPIDRSSQPIGVTAQNSEGVLENFVVLPAQTTMPTPAPFVKTFGTVFDGQTMIEMEVNEGDDPNLRFVTKLGSAVGEFDAPKPSGYPIEVRMSLTADGILSATAHDGASGRQIAEVVIQHQGELSDSDKQAATSRLRGLDVERSASTASSPAPIPVTTPAAAPAAAAVPPTETF